MEGDAFAVRRTLYGAGGRRVNQNIILLYSGRTICAAQKRKDSGAGLRGLRWSFAFRAANHAPESDVTGRTVHRFRVPRGRTIALAIVGGAQMRAALEHLAAERNIGVGRIMASTPRDAPRLAEHVAGCPAPFRASARLGQPVLRERQSNQ